MTNQELYSTVRTHLLTQMAKALRPSIRYDASDPGCAYRGMGGLKCAVGCLIPDERYTSELEGKSASYHTVCVAAGISETQEALANALQHVHDGFEPDEWEQRLNLVAGRFGVVAV